MKKKMKVVKKGVYYCWRMQLYTGAEMERRKRNAKKPTDPLLPTDFLQLLGSYILTYHHFLFYF